MTSVSNSVTVCVPRDSANDDHGILVRWCKENGEAIRAGETLCEIEFSKAVIEVPAPADGYVNERRGAEGDEMEVGAPLALITDSPQIAAGQGGNRSDSPSSTAVQGSSRATSKATSKATTKAQRLLDEHQLDIGLFAQFAIIKERHVLAHLQSRQAAGAEGLASNQPLDGERIELSPVRRRAAAALAKSVAEIPHSFLTRWLPALALDAHAKQLSVQHDLMISISDLLVAGVAHCAARDRRAIVRWANDSLWQRADVHVGFALNQANGDLLVPVVRDADQLDWESLCGRIRGLQKAALRKKLTPADLSGAGITVSSLIGSGAHQVTPIIAPDQAVIVALGDRCAFAGVECFALTIGFDHRALNGAEAGEFLTAVASFLEGKSNHE